MELPPYANAQTGVGYRRSLRIVARSSINLFSALRLEASDRTGNALRPALATIVEYDIKLTGASNMGKYVLGWALGVPVIVLVIIFLIFH
jgi:hypothetical protein